ncbi:hypothetical protein HYZ64_03920 [Candidatus Berkelbacteria bacterium]|nr:hypothetical protein [Candidatus Berkelbacteria bacterium]
MGKGKAQKTKPKTPRISGPLPFHLLNRKERPGPSRGVAKIKNYLSRVHSWSR